MTLLGAGDSPASTFPRRGAVSLTYPDGRVVQAMPRGVFREAYTDRGFYVVTGIAFDGDSHGLRRLVPPEAGEEGIAAAERELWAELEVIESRLRPHLVR